MKSIYDLFNFFSERLEPYIVGKYYDEKGAQTSTALQLKQLNKTAIFFGEEFSKLYEKYHFPCDLYIDKQLKKLFLDAKINNIDIKTMRQRIEDLYYLQILLEYQYLRDGFANEFLTGSSNSLKYGELLTEYNELLVHFEEQLTVIVRNCQKRIPDFSEFVSALKPDIRLHVLMLMDMDKLCKHLNSAKTLNTVFELLARDEKCLEGLDPAETTLQLLTDSDATKLRKYLGMNFVRSVLEGPTKQPSVTQKSESKHAQPATAAVVIDPPISQELAMLYMKAKAQARLLWTKTPSPHSGSPDERPATPGSTSPRRGNSPFG